MFSHNAPQRDKRVNQKSCYKCKILALCRRGGEKKPLMKISLAYGCHSSLCSWKKSQNELENAYKRQLTWAQNGEAIDVMVKWVLTYNMLSMRSNIMKEYTNNNTRYHLLNTVNTTGHVLSALVWGLFKPQNNAGYKLGIYNKDSCSS